DGIPVDKRRKTNIRPAGICETKIKVMWFKNSSDHTHTLNKSGMNKYSSTICTLVTNKAVKNYAPVAIINAVREFAKNDLGLNNSVEYLRHRKVANIKYKIQGPINAHLVGSASLGTNISETLSYLKTLILLTFVVGFTLFWCRQT
ncbi:17011_t:CDS:2, partial [Gigaspora rosea]